MAQEQIGMDEADFMEWTHTTNDIIKAFADRGWALYELGQGPMMFTSVDMIMEFVKDGRAEDVLKVGINYLPLPLVQDSRDTFQVTKAVEEMGKQLRGPYFVNLATMDDESVIVLGQHLVDSIVVEPPFLNLVTDVRFGYKVDYNTIEIHLTEVAHTIHKQIMLALR